MLSLDEVEAAGGYTVIYADAPWRYTQNGRGAAENHYRTMSLEEIRALPVARIAAPTSVLFLWGTWPKLLEVQSVIPAWGFEYKTLGFTWIKHYGKSEKPFWGGGSWTRSNEEFCLLAVRGKPRRADTQAARAVHQLVEEWCPEQLRAPHPGEHSAKPAIVRDRIVQLLGDVPRIELFARERVAGWDAWGLEAPGGSDVDLTGG